MSQGEVLYYSDKIGYCFIRPDDGGVFVHRAFIARIEESKPLEPGDRVPYETASDGRRGTLARDARVDKHERHAPSFTSPYRTRLGGMKE